MKNLMLIDIDTDREKTILFGKPPDSPQPETKEDAGKMILNDIACLSEALTTLILMVSENEYGKKEELVAASIKTISSIMIESVEPTPPTEPTEATEPTKPTLPKNEL